MPYITPKEDITLKIGRANVMFKGGETTLVTHVQHDAYLFALQQQEQATTQTGDESIEMALVDDDPEVLALQEEMALVPKGEDAELPVADREQQIDDVILELRSLNDPSVLTKSTGEVKISEIRKRLGFSISDEERDAAEARLKEAGVL